MVVVAAAEAPIDRVVVDLVARLPDSADTGAGVAAAAAVVAVEAAVERGAVVDDKY